MFKGGLAEVLKILSVEEELPHAPIISPEKLRKMEGKIIDKRAYLHLNKFCIVVDDRLKIKLYRVDRKTYYNVADIGTDLPLIVVNKQAVLFCLIVPRASARIRHAGEPMAKEH